MSEVILVMGTRPDAIKLAPLYLELKKRFKVTLCLTGQHGDLLSDILGLFQIKPEYNLNVMRNNQDLFQLTNRILSTIKEVYQSEMPKWVLVHGDTTTCFASALGAFYCGIPVGHVEAGLRTNNIKSPFPEEFNRQAVTRLCSLHFAPTEEAKENLLNEKVPPHKVHVTGNTIVDAVKTVSELTAGEFNMQNRVKFPFPLKDHEFALVTVHRAENTNNLVEMIKYIYFQETKEEREKIIQTNLREVQNNTWDKVAEKYLYYFNDINEKK